jgi:hypothetical protein
MTAAEIIQYNRDRGYVLPDTDSMTATDNGASNLATPDDVVSQARSKRSGKSVKAKIPTVKVDDKEFAQSLFEDNIDIEPSADGSLNEIKKIISREYPVARRKKVPKDTGEANWNADMSKCKKSHEAIFQRTIMMELIDRHKLDEQLDYICEALFISDRMPRRDKKTELAQPKPDLAVAFTTTSLIPGDASLRRLALLGELQGHMCPEGKGSGQVDRAFHFFSIEVKGKLGKIGNNEAEFQNLNTASQALHNMYLFMKKADDVDTFLNKVRFFSIVATAQSFEVRVHRAVQLDSGDVIAGSNYNIGFNFDNVAVVVGSDYTKEKVSRIVYNILFNYGVKILHPILKDAVEAVFQQFEEKKSQSLTGSLSQSRGKRTPEDPLESSSSAKRRRLDDWVFNTEGEDNDASLQGSPIPVG